jgi:hypothetical protein
MKAVELAPYLQKFITVTLNDGTEISGYISNPEDFRNHLDDDGQVTLVNGLQNSVTEISRIVKVEVAVREDTTEIPVFGETVEASRRRQKEDFNTRLDELFDKSLSDTLEVKLPNGKVIKSHPDDEE